MKMVFTGPATDGNGKSIDRADLIWAYGKKGNLFVENRVTADTRILVASRGDTAKAKAAAQRGLAMFTYPEFISRYLYDVEIARGHPANAYVDNVPVFKPSTQEGWKQLDLSVL